MTVISAAVKLLLASLRVKVSVATSPVVRLLSLLVMVTVGAVVSAATVLTARLSGPAAVLLLPAASVKVLAATLMVAALVLLAVGVKVAE